jgi:apolipoprotein N-acyltransferase
LSGGQRAGFGLAYVLTTFASFPHPLGEGVLDLGIGVAWFAPACLLLAVRGLPVRRAAALGFAASLMAHAAVLHWGYVVTVDYGHAPVIVGLIAPFGMALYIAIFGGLFAAGAVALGPARAASPLLLAALWTALEHFRSFALGGFPWATLGYSQHLNPALLGLAAWTGVLGLSFSVVLGSASALQLATSAGAPALRRGALLGVLAVIGLHAFGAATLPPALSGEPQVRIAVLQGNIAQGVKWSTDWAERTLQIYEELSRQAADAGARWIVWPETAVPGAPEGDPELLERLTALAREIEAELFVGAVGLRFREGEEQPSLYDSALWIDARGRPRDRYDKSHLVPFGEYLPLRSLLGRLVRAIATGSAGRDVSAGARPRALAVDGPEPQRAGPEDLEAGERGVLVGVPICYELIFPDLVRRFAADGAQVLLGITNDAWYGRTGAPYQFLAMTAMRSAENGTWTARAANTGVSAFIDARGRVQERTRIFERGWIAADVPLRPLERTTFYTRHGDVFAWACWAAAGLGLLAARGSGGSGRGAERP